MTETATTPQIKLSPIKESREKALRSMANTRFLTVWEGAVRSSKTVYALAAFALYMIYSPENVFLLSGRTLRTVESNCILEDYGLLNMLPGSVYLKGRGEIVFNVQRDDTIITKKVKVFGAADIRAYMALRGNTYGGWFADEINVHDKEFVIEAMKRTAVSKDRRHFWTLNPDNPSHWIYSEFLDHYDAMDKDAIRRLGGYRWWHFTPRDNPAMTPKMLASLEEQYPKDTYLYKRYILGQRCIAEGLVYPKVDKSYFRPFDISKVKIEYCAIDYGADHATVFLFGGYFDGNKNDWRIVREYYDKGSDKTTYDHYVNFLEICKELRTDPNKVMIAIDPAAKGLRVEFQNRGLYVVKAKNDVLPGIDYTRRLIYSNKLIFHESLTHLLKEFPGYRWDPNGQKTGKDAPIKIDDDCVDTLRYFAYTFITQYII